MKTFSLVILCSLLACKGAFGQATNSDYLDKVTTIDSTIETLYEVISGDAGEKRDWELFRYLFTEDAKLIPVRQSQDEGTAAVYWTPEQYVERAGPILEKDGFFEKEISNKVEQYGSIAHTFSTYESYRKSTDSEPFTRGINSIQLMHDGDRWWVVNIYWLGETDDNPIPDRYLPEG
ncbi:MAG: hypothetical protein RIF33_13210 [Cyclobacteriaceae bacterium]